MAARATAKWPRAHSSIGAGRRTEWPRSDGPSGGRRICQMAAGAFAKWPRVHRPSGRANRRQVGQRQWVRRVNVMSDSPAGPVGGTRRFSATRSAPWKLAARRRPARGSRSRRPHARRGRVSESGSSRAVAGVGPVNVVGFVRGSAAPCAHRTTDAANPAQGDESGGSPMRSVREPRWRAAYGHGCACGSSASHERDRPRAGG